MNDQFNVISENLSEQFQFRHDKNSTISFYENIPIPNPTASDKFYKWDEIMTQLYSDDDFIHRLLNDNALYSLAIPFKTVKNITEEIHQWKDVAKNDIVSKRAHMLVVGLLHRLGFKIINPKTGAFQVLENVDSFAFITFDDLMKYICIDPNDGRDYNLYTQLLKRLMGFSNMIGFVHYTKQIWNHIERYTHNPKHNAKRAIFAFLREITMETIIAITFFNVIQKTDTGTCVIEHKASFLDTIPDPEETGTLITESLIKSKVDQTSKICKHGVLTKARQHAPESQQRSFLCLAHMASFSKGQDCGVSFPLKQ